MDDALKEAKALMQATEDKRAKKRGRQLSFLTDLEETKEEEENDFADEEPAIPPKRWRFPEDRTPPTVPLSDKTHEMNVRQTQDQTR